VRYSIHFSPAVEDDVLSAFTWYADKAPGLGEEFLRVFYAKTSEISLSPHIYSIVFNDVRRSLLKRFPYAIYFRVTETSVHVYGLLHCAREPSQKQSDLELRIR
jgi:plasmid stabilization system protein ParE